MLCKCYSNLHKKVTGNKLFKIIPSQDFKQKPKSKKSFYRTYFCEYFDCILSSFINFVIFSIFSSLREKNTFHQYSV